MVLLLEGPWPVRPCGLRERRGGVRELGGPQAWASASLLQLRGGGSRRPGARPFPPSAAGRLSSLHPPVTGPVRRARPCHRDLQFHGGERQAHAEAETVPCAAVPRAAGAGAFLVSFPLTFPSFSLQGSRKFF